MKVWVVTRGYYSDMYVVGVFSSEEKFKEYAALCEKDVSEEPIDEVFELDDFVGKFPKGRTPYMVWMNKNGDEVTVRRTVPEDVDDEFKVCRGSGRCHTSCWAIDEKHALKIANERRTQAVASGE